MPLSQIGPYKLNLSQQNGKLLSVTYLMVAPHSGVSSPRYRMYHKYDPSKEYREPGRLLLFGKIHLLSWFTLKSRRNAFYSRV